MSTRQSILQAVTLAIALAGVASSTWLLVRLDSRSLAYDDLLEEHERRLGEAEEIEATRKELLVGMVERLRMLEEDLEFAKRLEKERFELAIVGSYAARLEVSVITSKFWFEIANAYRLGNVYAEALNFAAPYSVDDISKAERSRFKAEEQTERWSKLVNEKLD